MIVADTNLIVNLLLPGEMTVLAEAVYHKDPVWIAPLLWRSEFYNVLVTFLRRRLFSLEDAQGALDEGLSWMHGSEYEIRLPSVLDLAHASGCSAYDCEYVALAQNQGCYLITFDRKVQGQFPEIALSPEKYLDVSLP